MRQGDLAKRLEITAEAFDLPIGVTTNDIHCPWCSRNKSFSVTRTLRGDLLFVCHRAACAEAGYLRQRGGSRSPPSQGRLFTPRVFDYETCRLEGAKLSRLVDAYGLAEAEVRWAEWSYSPKIDRLVMPVLSAVGSHRGIVTKAFDSGEVPKSLNYKEVDDNWMAWYLRPEVAIQNTEGKCNTVVLVEDMVSALKASRFYPTAALLGTFINPSMLLEILSVSDNIVICLDKDATQKAYEYSEQFAVYGNFRTVPLSKGIDIKDMNEEELGEWSERL